jgi:hypothetical protein
VVSPDQDLTLYDRLTIKTSDGSVTATSAVAPA